MARLRRPASRSRAEVAEWAPPVTARADAPLSFRPAPGWLPLGRRVYAIGDIHGCATALTAVLARIRADLAARPEVAELVLLGDYIDHGPDTAAVLDLLTGPAPVSGARLIALRGDHEQRLLHALAGEAPEATDFLAEGGAASLASWAIPPATPPATWAAHLPPAHLAFLRGLRLSHRVGGYVFVHAGLRPGVALARQLRADVLTIRQPFLSEPASFGAVVVHGHSVAPAPAIEAGRIGLDTGAGLGGSLSCAVLEGETIALFSIPAA